MDRRSGCDTRAGSPSRRSRSRRAGALGALSGGPAAVAVTMTEMALSDQSYTAEDYEAKGSRSLVAGTIAGAAGAEGACPGGRRGRCARGFGGTDRRHSDRSRHRDRGILPRQLPIRRRRGTGRTKLESSERRVPPESRGLRAGVLRFLRTALGQSIRNWVAQSARDAGRLVCSDAHRRFELHNGHAPIPCDERAGDAQIPLAYRFRRVRRSPVLPQR